MKQREKLVILIDTSGKNVIMAEKTNSEAQTELKKEKNRIRVREWRKKNPDKYKQHQEYVREWKRNNPDKVKQSNKKYYKENRDWLLESFKQYHQNKKKDRESVNKSTKKGRKTIVKVRKNA